MLLKYIGCIYILTCSNVANGNVTVDLLAAADMLHHFSMHTYEIV
jgi:hypothetical protein